MKLSAVFLSAFLLVMPAVAASHPANTSDRPTVYIAATDGFDTDIAAAIEKKKTPVIVVDNKDKADYLLFVTSVFSKDETTGGKIARCMFLDCAGANGYSSVSVKMTRRTSSAVVWAYEVRKSMSGPVARQSLSEAIAKHLKNDYLKKMQ